MNFKIVEDGKFKVYESGLIEKLKKGIYVPATMTDGLFGRNQMQPELIVSYTEDKIQTHYYAKRLLADAFVPSLNNSGFINYLDGDYTNLAANNLFRETQVDRSRKVLATRVKNAPNCKLCDNKTINLRHVCNDCLAKEKEQKRLAWIADKNTRRSMKATKEFGSINLDNLKSIEKAYVERKMKGYTLEEIGKEFGKSRERIRQVLVEVKERNV